jgi:hypothetical protein
MSGAIRIPPSDESWSNPEASAGSSLDNDFAPTPNSAHRDEGAGGNSATVPAIQVANQLPIALQVYQALCNQYGTQPLGSISTALVYPVSTVQFESTTTTLDMLVLAHILEYNATITHVDFSQCSIGNHGCYPLAHVLATNCESALHCFASSAHV